jgi:hypothetical protein
MGLGQLPDADGDAGASSFALRASEDEPTSSCRRSRLYLRGELAALPMPARRRRSQEEPPHFFIRCRA